MPTALVLASALAALLAGCAPSLSPPVTDDGAARVRAEDSYYRRAVQAGEPVFRVEPAQSLVVIEVRRDGPLGHLGHDHVVASHEVRGHIAPAAARGDLSVRLDRLVVDEPGLRAEAGFDTQPSAAAIAATRTNMLDKTLQAARHPYAFIRVDSVLAEAGDARLGLAITLNGITRRLSVPARIEADAQRLLVSGRLRLKQTDFGIEPFSILAGAIRVGDEVAVRFRIHAARIAF